MNNHSERRSSLRRPIHHDALMITEHGETINCIIADFCLDGMFIKFMSEVSNRQAVFPDKEQGLATIELQFKGDQGQAYSINAHVVHHIDGACGLRFFQRYDQAIQSLVNLSVNLGVSNDQSLPVKVILDECIQYIHKFFGPLLEDFWEALEDTLRAEAVKASNDQAANALMALAEKIKQRHQTLQKGVMKAIEDPVAAFNKHIEKRKAMSDRLTVIDKDEFEDWLVSRVLVMRCEADYQSQLMPLKLRLDALGVGDKRHHQSVFGPALLVSSFQPVIQSLIVDTSTEKLIFRVFEQKVMALLKGLYEGLNAILIAYNILPKLKIKQTKAAKPKSSQAQTKQTAVSEKHEAQVRQSPSASPTINRTSAGSHPAPIESKQTLKLEDLNELINRESQTFTQPPFSPSSLKSGQTSSFSENQQVAQSALSNIGELLRSIRAYDAPKVDTALSEAQTPYSSTEFDEGLAMLQASSRAIDWNEAPKSLMERVQTHLSSQGQEKAIDDDKQAAIDVVDRFFLSMRSNPRISSEAKQYLLKLEVPVLKVLLKDETFFEDQQSSVRAVMNRIAQLGAKGSTLNPPSREKVSGLVNKIVEEFEHDTSIFDHVLAELDELIERQNSLYVKNVERVAAAADGMHKVEGANLAVANAINERVAHKFVPSAVVTLINEGWKEYLNLTFIKLGDNSEQWHEALSVIDRLIAYGNDPRIPIDIKVILPKIQEGLKLVSGNNEASLKVREALKAFILNAPKGMHLSEKAQQHKVPESEEDLIQRNIHKSQALKDWILKIKTIPLGTWLTFQKTESDTRYMRLVWVAKGFSKFVFVNHQGRKVIELGLFKLANYFKDGRIAVDADYELPIVNQGLDDMVKDVYDKIAYQSSHDSKTGLINKTEFCRQVRLQMKQGKRTSECSLLFIRFRQPEADSQLLADDFAKQVVSALETLSNGASILGRASETDFLAFKILEDKENYRVSAQEELIKLCQQPNNKASDLMVVIGESRAHLGFNNPDSMIKHASDAISSVGHSQDTASGLTERSDRPPSSLTESEASGGVVILDKAANADTHLLDFDALVFQLWGQGVSKIDGEGALSKASAQLNLASVVEGETEIYKPPNEKTSLQLDRWWIKTLVKLQNAQAHLFADFEKIRVPLSAYALNSDVIIEELIAVNQSGALKAANIYFDVYDCIEMKDVALCAMRMSRLKEEGYCFCLDDFGSARSPFAFLKSLPVDMIKIDDAFINALNQEDNKHESEEDVAADSIIEIAHYMGKQVLAAGVENAVCLQKMKRLKVDFVQGSTVALAKQYDI